MGVDEKLINAEMLVSRSFMASAQSMLGDSYKAIIRNIPLKYGDTIVQHLMENLEMDCRNEKEKRQFLFSSTISADTVDVRIDDESVILTTTGCNHHRAINIEHKFELDKTRVCPVGIIGICFIEHVTGTRVAHGKKYPAGNKENGKCTIKFDLNNTN